MTTLPEYNSTRNDLVLSEYGRNVQRLVEYLMSIGDRQERNRKANTVIAIMGNLNPHLRDTADYKHKLWDHLFAMSGFKLDVDSPYPIPTPEILNKKPDRVPYLGNHIKFRFYGRNVQSMIKTAAEMEDGEEKQYFINLIASFMRNSSKNWNEENLSAEAIADHMAVLSEGKLKVNAEDLTLSDVARYPTHRPNNNQRNFNKNRNFNKGRNQNQNQKQRRNKY